MTSLEDTAITLTRTERDCLRHSLGAHWEYPSGPFRVDWNKPRDREMLSTAVAVLEQIGWEVDDARDTYPLVIDEGAFSRLLRYLREDLQELYADADEEDEQNPAYQPTVAAFTCVIDRIRVTR